MIHDKIIVDNYVESVIIFIVVNECPVRVTDAKGEKTDGIHTERFYHSFQFLFNR
jgi:hypothetical protein